MASKQQQAQLDAFIEASISQQLGGTPAGAWSFAQDAFERAISSSSKMTLAWNNTNRMPYSLNGWAALDGAQQPWDVGSAQVGNGWKITGALRTILQSGAETDFLVDMQDHRARSVLTDAEKAAPVFCFNRPTRQRVGRILWPLPRYHDLESNHFLGGLDPHRVAWRDKSERVVWRGGAGNRARLGKHGRGSMIRMVPLLRKHAAGKLSEDETLRALRTMPRYKILDRHFHDPRFDVGFTASKGLPVKDVPFLGQYEQDHMPLAQFQDYKYILVLPGSDVASSFYWTMNSGSVGLVMDCSFETFATQHFRRWEHYVPISRKATDLHEKLDWCDKNQEACQEMTRKAASVCALLARADLRDTIQRGIVGRLNAVIKGLEFQRPWAGNNLERAVK